MKKLFYVVLLFIFSFSLIPTKTEAATLENLLSTLHWYAGAKLGYTHEFLGAATYDGTSFSPRSNNDGPAFNFAFSGGAKYALSEQYTIRTELEYMYRTNVSISPRYSSSLHLEQSFESHSILLNGYFDWHIEKKITLYGTAGLGIGIIDMKAKSIASLRSSQNTSAAFAFQFGGGVAYDITNAIAVDLGLRYIGFAVTQQSGTVPKQYISGLDLNLGVRYTF
ncbi:MAG: outer membrane protein [Desulfovibrionaceae bacterium]